MPQSVCLSITAGHFQLRQQQKMPLSPTDCARAVALVDSGLTLQEVENITGFPRSSISRAVIRFRLTGSYERRQGSGRNRTTSARDDRFVVSLQVLGCSRATEEPKEALQEEWNNLGQEVIRGLIDSIGRSHQSPSGEVNITKKSSKSRSQVITCTCVKQTIAKVA
ncbi:CDK-activating kinase assembly factor MAT1 [Homalodisca vitripennis]|nr:CDK-activating kinase assembly factor MAT1 [Homalodisca vitripennis]